MQSGDLVGSWKMSCVCETRDERRRRKREIPARGTGRRDEIPETRSAASRAASAFFSLVRRASCDFRNRILSFSHLRLVPT